MATGTITPPAGFELETPASQTSEPQMPQSNQPNQSQSGIIPPAGFVLEDSQSSAAPEPSFGENVAKGVSTAAAQTLSNVGKLGSYIPGVDYVAGKVGDVLGLPKLNVNSYDTVARSTAVNANAANQTVGGKVGTGLENIGEFFLGDEALKGLSLAERAGMLAKVAKLAESHPVVAKIIGYGLTAVRGGAVTTGQQLAHGSTLGEAAETGLAAAGLGAAAGAAAEGTKAGARALKGVLATSTVQKPLQNGIRTILGTVADDAGVANSASPSIRKTAEETADAVYAKSKAQYGVLDEATGGRFQRFKDRLENIRRSLNNLTGTEEDAVQEAKLLKAQKETEDGMQESFNDAKAKGIDPKLVDEANANFKKSQALYDLDSNIKKAVSGGRPGVTSADLLDKSRELVDPKKFLTRINSLYDSGRLQDALGEKGADDLFNHAIENNVNHSKILRNQTIAKGTAKKIAGGAATAIGAGSAYELGKEFLK